MADDYAARARSYALLAFQAGDGARRRTEAFGHTVSPDFHRRRPDRVAEPLTAAGLVVRARQVRERDEEGEYAELTPQAMLPARTPVVCGRP